MTYEQFVIKINALVKQRNHCCDVLGKVILGMTYQTDIDKLVDEYPEFAQLRVEEKE